jgi:hypothetical protein
MEGQQPVVEDAADIELHVLVSQAGQRSAKFEALP